MSYGFVSTLNRAIHHTNFVHECTRMKLNNPGFFQWFFQEKKGMIFLILEITEWKDRNKNEDICKNKYKFFWNMT